MAHLWSLLAAIGGIPFCGLTVFFVVVCTVTKRKLNLSPSGSIHIIIALAATFDMSFHTSIFMEGCTLFYSWAEAILDCVLLFVFV